MRYTAVPAAALLVLLTASPALAGAGLPKIASLELGPHKAAIENDSRSARIGNNTMTVEITDVPAGHSVHLRFIGPQGQTLEPVLRPLQVLAGPEEAHGDGGHDAKAAPAAPKDDHGKANDGHGNQSGGHDAKPAGQASDGHDAKPAEKAPASQDAKAEEHASDSHNASADDHGSGGTTFAARTNVKFPEGGTWKAVLTIEADHGDKLVAEAPFEVTYGGPNRLFVASSGLIIGGSILYGAIQRRRKSSGR